MERHFFGVVMVVIVVAMGIVEVVSIGTYSVASETMDQDTTVGLIHEELEWLRLWTKGSLDLLHGL